MITGRGIGKASGEHVSYQLQFFGRISSNANTPLWQVNIFPPGSPGTDQQPGVSRVGHAEAAASNTKSPGQNHLS